MGDFDLVDYNLGLGECATYPGKPATFTVTPSLPADPNDIEYYRFDWGDGTIETVAAVDLPYGDPYYHAFVAIGILLPSVTVSTAVNDVTATIPVGNGPHGVAYASGSVWVTDAYDNTVVRVNPSSNTVIATISVGALPRHVTNGAGSIWVSNFDDGTVSRIDPSTNTVLVTITVGNNPRSLVYGDESIWVANVGDGTVSRIDPATNTVVATVATGAGPTGLAYGNSSVWVTEVGDNTVSRIDPESELLTTTIAVGAFPQQVLYASDSVWVTDSFDQTVSRVNPFTDVVDATIPVTGSGQPYGLAFDGFAVVVTDQSGDDIYRIDPVTNTIVSTVDLGGSQKGVAYGNGAIWVAADNLLKLESVSYEYDLSTYVVVQELVKIVGTCDLLSTAQSASPWVEAPQFYDASCHLNTFDGPVATDVLGDVTFTASRTEDGIGLQWSATWVANTNLESPLFQVMTGSASEDGAYPGYSPTASEVTGTGFLVVSDLTFTTTQINPGAHIVEIVGSISAGDSITFETVIVAQYPLYIFQIGLLAGEGVTLYNGYINNCTGGPLVEGTLGSCGIEQYAVDLMVRGGQIRLDTLQNIISITWSRELDAISAATIVLAKGTGCCELLVEADPYATEIRIQRQGFTVWEGPVYEVRENLETMEIFAKDNMHLLERRIIRNTIDDSIEPGSDCSLIAESIIRQAFLLDNPNIIEWLYIIPGAPFIARKTEEQTRSYAFGELSDITRVGIDWAVIGRRILIFPADLPIGIGGRITDDDIIGDYTVVKSGRDFSTRQVTLGQGDLYAIQGGVDARYGLVENVNQESDLLSQGSVDNAAITRYEVTPIPPIWVSLEGGVYLKPTTPTTIAELVPGIVFPGSFTKYCNVVTQNFRLQRLTVDVTGGIESVSIGATAYGYEVNSGTAYVEVEV